MILLLAVAGCGVPVPTAPLAVDPNWREPFAAPGFGVAPPAFRHVSLTGPAPGGAPIAKLGSGGTLELRFDELGGDPRNFAVRLRHLNHDFRESALLPGVFLAGAQEDQFGSAGVSGSEAPRFTHYRYRFPNTVLRPLVSGAYALDVFDGATRARLFSMLFFLEDETGDAGLELQQYMGAGASERRMTQPFLTYQYPKEFRQPSLDIRVTFSQSQFFGRMREADVMDQSEEGELRYHLSRPRAFNAGLAVFGWHIPETAALGGAIRDVNLGALAELILNRHTDGLELPAPGSWQNRGDRVSGATGRYYWTRFDFETADAGRYFLTGTFNAWRLDPEMELKPDAGSGMRSVWFWLKSGTHHYRVAAVEGDRVMDVLTGTPFHDQRHRYHAFVWYRDRQLGADRLLRVASEIDP